jgi:hypothetical protein
MWRRRYGVYTRIVIPFMVGPQRPAGGNERVPLPALLIATKERFRRTGLEPTGLGVAEFAKLHAGEVERWVKFLTEIGLRK